MDWSFDKCWNWIVHATKLVESLDIRKLLILFSLKNRPFIIYSLHSLSEYSL